MTSTQHTTVAPLLFSSAILAILSGDSGIAHCMVFVQCCAVAVDLGTMVCDGSLKSFLGAALATYPTLTSSQNPWCVSKSCAFLKDHRAV